MWQQYSGWKADIGKRYEGEISSTKARLAASGADPSVIARSVGGLETKRAEELSALDQGATFQELQKGFSIAKGETPSPYSDKMKGQVWDMGLPGSSRILGMFGYGNMPTEGELAPFKAAQAKGEIGEGVYFEDWSKTQGAGATKTMEEYYSKFYGQASAGSAQKTPEQLAMERAKNAGRGATDVSTVGGMPTGAGALTTASPWAVQYNEQSPWV